MRDYGKVSPQFWIGETGKKLRAAGPEAQVVSLYLMTCPHSNMIGLYYLPVMYLAHETGLGLEGASKGLQRAIDAGFCSYDEASEMVFVHEMARFQIGSKLSAGDKRCKGIQNEYDSLPENPFLVQFFERYEGDFNMENCRGKSTKNRRPLQAPSKPLGSQEQEQEQEQDICANGFARFWDAYPKKKSKGTAEKVFLKIKPSEQLLETMLESIEQAKTSDGWKKDNGQFIPYPATWLNAKGWEDDAGAMPAEQDSIFAGAI